MNAAEERRVRLEAEPMRPAAPVATFVGGASASLVEIWERRELLNRLVRREIRARYKDSALGLLWSLVRPIVSLLIYYLVIGRVLGASRSIPDFAVYIFTGLTVWQLVSEILSTTTASMIANSGIIKKTHLPREIFPLAAVGAALFNFAMQFAILLVGALVIGGVPLDSRLLYLPMGLAVAVVWSTALGLVLSAANVYLRDIQYLVEVTLMVGMWASPIVYSLSMVTEHIHGLALEIYLANPVTTVTLAFQRAIWLGGAEVPTASHLPERLWISLAIGLVMLMVAQRVFQVLQRNLAQEL